jgi:hypothetical protein
MRWRHLYVALGAVVWVGMPWGLQGMLQQSGWTQQTADSWGPLRFHAWWLVWLLGGVGGWFLGRLRSGWTGRRAAQADVQAARDLLTRAQASWQAQQTTERAQLAQAWAEVIAAQQAAQQAASAAADAQRQAEATQRHWQAWAAQEVAQARAQIADAERRRWNATATAERRKRKLARLLSERSHPATQ